MTTKVWEPTEEQAVVLHKFNNNSEYYLKNISKIRESYAGMFIAISDQKVLLSSSNIDELLALIQKRIAKKKAHQVYLAYVPNKDEIRIA